MSNKLEQSKDFNDILVEKGLNETKKILSQSLQQIEDQELKNKPKPFQEKQFREIKIEDINFLPKSLFDMIKEISDKTQTPIGFVRNPTQII